MSKESKAKKNKNKLSQPVKRNEVTHEKVPPRSHFFINPFIRRGKLNLRLIIVLFIWLVALVIALYFVTRR